jgi:hypothetical protein
MLRSPRWHRHEQREQAPTVRGRALYRLSDSVDSTPAGRPANFGTKDGNFRQNVSDAPHTLHRHYIAIRNGAPTMERPALFLLTIRSTQASGPYRRLSPSVGPRASFSLWL